MERPLVSVVLPAYNASAHVDAALGSICSQTYERLEIIVINDGSTDDTLARLEGFARRDARVKLISRENRGLIPTLNEGVASATGELIARMDADDFAFPQRIERQVEAFNRLPGLGMCGTGIHHISRGRVFETRRDLIFRTGDLRTLSLFFTIFIHPTVMLDRRVLGPALHFDSAYPHAEDFELFRRIAASHVIHLIHEPLLAYRLHDNSVSVRHRRTMRRTHLKIVAENLRNDELTGDPEALVDVGETVSRRSVDRLQTMICEMKANVETREPRLRASYEAGIANLIIFLMNMLIDEGEPALVCRLLSALDQWKCVRRRERALLRIFSRAPRLASASLNASNAIQYILDRPGSFPEAQLGARAQ